MQALGYFPALQSIISEMVRLQDALGAERVRRHQDGAAAQHVPVEAGHPPVQQVWYSDASMDFKAVFKAALSACKVRLVISSLHSYLCIFQEKRTVVFEIWAKTPQTF